MRAAIVQVVPIMLAQMAWAQMCHAPEFVLSTAFVISVMLVVYLFLPRDVPAPAKRRAK